MNFIAGKHITFGITGGIAAYKIPYLIREVIKRGGQARSVITPSAEKFISPLVLETLTGDRCFSDMFLENSRTIHIDLGKDTDLFVIAPATYNTIGKITAGIADNLLTAVVASADVPILLFPSMNTRMWLNPINQRNVKVLKKNGYNVIPPESGELACGEEGIGRLPDIEMIISEINKALCPKKDFTGKKIIVTGGGTFEPVDDVRVITNLSSGRMAKEIAEILDARGGEVVFVYGNMNVPLPSGVRGIKAETGKDMERILKKEIKTADILVMAAAVSDFIPEKAKGKVRRKDKTTLVFRKTTDILKSLGEYKHRKIYVGFALEDKDLEKNALKKMEEKSLDIIVANTTNTLNSETGTGFIFRKDGKKYEFKNQRKDIIAWEIAESIIALFKNI